MTHHLCFRESQRGCRCCCRSLRPPSISHSALPGSKRQHLSHFIRALTNSCKVACLQNDRYSKARLFKASPPLYKWALASQTRSAGSHSFRLVWDWSPGSPDERREGWFVASPKLHSSSGTSAKLSNKPASTRLTLSHCSVCSLLCRASTMASPPTGMIFSLCSFLFSCFSL